MAWKARGKTLTLRISHDEWEVLSLTAAKVGEKPTTVAGWILRRAIAERADPAAGAEGAGLPLDYNLPARVYALEVNFATRVHALEEAVAAFKAASEETGLR